MKLKKDIAKLQTKVPAIEWPKEPIAFQHFASDLRKVLGENWLGHDWDWDPYEQNFYTTWKESDGIEYIGAIYIEHTATLNPTKPLAEEIARLIEEREAVTAHARQVFAAARRIGDSIATSKQLDAAMAARSAS